jgi:hypothetical protein
LAKDGIFTQPKQSPLDSVLNTELDEILTYLSWQNACNKFEELVTEINKKQQK